jgi:hypothetical protein
LLALGLCTLFSLGGGRQCQCKEEGGWILWDCAARLITMIDHCHSSYCHRRLFLEENCGLQNWAVCSLGVERSKILKGLDSVLHFSMYCMGWRVIFLKIIRLVCILEDIHKLKSMIWLHIYLTISLCHRVYRCKFTVNSVESRENQHFPSFIQQPLSRIFVKTMTADSKSWWRCSPARLETTH